MARYISSESDDYYPPPPRTRQHSQKNDDRLYRLTANLQDTTKNLKSLDRMIDEYTSIGQSHRSTIDRLQGDLDQTQDDLHYERARSAALERDYGSDSESSPRGGYRSRRSAVRFADDMNKELHGIHQSVRDLSSEQLKLEESFNREIDRRDRHDNETRRSLEDIKVSLKGVTALDPLSARVEKRLQAIQSEIRAERQLLDRDHHRDDYSALSNELKNAIQSTQAANNLDEKLRSQFLQSESLRHKVENELDSVKRRLDQTEGSRTALQSQVEQLRLQLSKADQERHRMRLDLDESRIESEVKEQRRRRAVEEEKSNNLERELRDLKTHLARSVGAVTELEDLRRRLDKSERQCAQLSDHIETLAKDLDNRERQSAKVITQLKDVSDKYEDADRQRNYLLQQVEELQQKLAVTTKELEKTKHEQRNTELCLQDSEKKKDEFKGRAQETVRQWKAKVKSLEKALDRQKHGTSEMLNRHEQLIKELEGFKQHGNYHQLQIESIRRELADALAVRAAQDEQLRLKDIEINELKSLRMDLDREYRDSRSIADKMEGELHSLRSRVACLSEDKHHLEDKLSAVESAHLLAQDQSRSLQDELKELSNIKAATATQLAEALAKNHDLMQAVVELQHRERGAREEVELYKKQLHQERNGLSKDYETLKQELNEAKVREAHTIQELTRKFRAHGAEQEAAIQALKMELSEEKSNAKIANRNADRLKEELDILEKRFKLVEEENVGMKRKLDLVRQEFETQTHLAEDDLHRVKKLEGQLGNAHLDLEKLEKQLINVIQELAIEIDAVVETASVDATSHCQPINGLKNLVSIGTGVPSHLITEMRNKIKWLRSEFRERLVRERRLRQEFRTALSASDADRQFLIQELVRKDEELDDLFLEKQEIALKEIQSMCTVEKLEEHVLDLSDELQLRKLREEEQKKLFVREKYNIISDMEDILDAQKEKAKIEERYRRLQDTLKSLQQDLKSGSMHIGKKGSGVLRSTSPNGILRSSSPNGILRSSSPNGILRSSSPNGILRSSSPSSNGRKKNHVRISASTPTKEFNSEDPVTQCHTPPPLSLSDEEFRARFIPRTPTEPDSWG